MQEVARTAAVVQPSATAYRRTNGAFAKSSAAAVTPSVAPERRPVRRRARYRPPAVSLARSSAATGAIPMRAAIQSIMSRWATAGSP